MLKHLVVIAIAVSGCGPQDTCSGNFAICDSDEWSSLPTHGTGTRLMECVDGRPTFTLCANRCVARGGTSDVCN